jgi:hypothetical protein
LAEAASAPPDGKLYIHGGGFTRIDAPAIPWALPQVAVVLRFDMRPEDFEAAYEIELLISDPTGESVVQNRFPVPIQTPTKPLEGEEQYLQLILSFGPLVFLRVGIFTVEVKLNGASIRSASLPVVKAAESPAAPPA